MSEEFTVIGRIRTAKGRSYPVVLDRASRFGTRFQVTDASVPALAALVRDFPEELNKALGSLGYWLRAAVKGALRHGGRPYAGWPPRVPLALSRREKSGSWARSALPEQPFGDLERAVGYLAEDYKFQVSTGWLSKAAARLAGKLQAGFRTRITASMRRKFIREGYRLGGKGEIAAPARPVIRPVYDALKHKFGPRIEARIQKYMRERRLAA